MQKNKSTYNPDMQISTSVNAKPKPKPSASLADNDAMNVDDEHYLDGTFPLLLHKPFALVDNLA